jgi:phage recombination protein Bet
MAVSNSLAKAQPQQQKKALTVTYKAGGADVTLSLGMIKKYLVTGSPETVTEQELMMFMSLCKYQGLNPFVRDAYLIKYGQQAATIVVGKGALEKRAARCDKYKGFEAGIIVRNLDGSIEERTGTFYIDGEELVGGWAKVFVDGYEKPVEVAVSVREYLGRKKDGSVNSQWATKPATMIRKVAKAQALREAFPEDMAGMYVAEEVGVDGLDEQIIQQPAAQEQAARPEIIEAPVADPEPMPEPDDFAGIMEG